MNRSDIAWNPAKQAAEARHARTLYMESRNADRKVEPSEGAPDLRAKLLNQRAEVVHQLGSEGRVMAISIESRPGAPTLRVLAASISVIDQARIGGSWHVCSSPRAGVFQGNQVVLLIAGHVVGMRNAPGRIDLPRVWIDELRPCLMEQCPRIPEAVSLSACLCILPGALSASCSSGGCRCCPGCSPA